MNSENSSTINPAHAGEEVAVNLKDSLAHAIGESVLLESEKNAPKKKKSADTDENKPLSNRSRILLSAFDEMYEHGFQGMRIESILKETNLGKGALYHHFPSKRVLGHTVIDEILAPAFNQQLSSLNKSSDPMARFCELMRNHAGSCTKYDINLGCPLHNLTQEMAGLDEGFQERLSLIFDQRHDYLALALKRGKALGQVCKDVQEWTISAFILSSIDGCV